MKLKSLLQERAKFCDNFKHNTKCIAVVDFNPTGEISSNKIRHENADDALTGTFTVTSLLPRHFKTSAAPSDHQGLSVVHFHPFSCQSPHHLHF